MKIAVFADFHGSARALRDAATVCRRETPDKTVICGDLFGYWSDPYEVVELLKELDGVQYLIKGNNDGPLAANLLDTMEDNAVMYHFGRTLFFTHGDRYNLFNAPPFLKEGDALVYGHTHAGGLSVRNGLYMLNVGSLARPRDGEPCYLVLDESGAFLKSPDGKVLYKLAWQN